MWWFVCLFVFRSHAVISYVRYTSVAYCTIVTFLHSALLFYVCLFVLDHCCHRFVVILETDKKATAKKWLWIFWFFFFIEFFYFVQYTIFYSSSEYSCFCWVRLAASLDFNRCCLASSKPISFHQSNGWLCVSVRNVFHSTSACVYI